MQRGGFVQKTKCPKCGGNVYLDSDHYGWFEQCLQCGFTRNMKKVDPVKAEDNYKYLADPNEHVVQLR
ncbi:MAG: hypothetical protein PHU23_03710 [Dehalococcoidales bacterium]|nr:hypothetical protein [Dehalococcoidales bacterium]